MRMDEIEDETDLDAFTCGDCGRLASSAYHRLTSASSPSSLRPSPSSSSSPSLPSPLYEQEETETAPATRLQPLTAFKQDNFPVFRCSKNKTMADPVIFLRDLDRAFTRYAVPAIYYEQILIGCMPNETCKQYVESNILRKGYTWTKSQALFIRRFMDPGTYESLHTKLTQLRQHSKGGAEYCEEFMALAARLGYYEDNEVIIRMMEAGLNENIRRNIRLRVSLQSDLLNASVDPDDDSALLSSQGIAHASLSALADDVIKAEQALGVADRSSRQKSNSFTPRRHSFFSRPSVAAAAPARPAAQAARKVRAPQGGRHKQQGARAARLELSADGRPFNATANPNRGGRGGGRGRGGRGGRGGRTIHPSALTAAAPLSEVVCFKCGKKGHKANQCRQGTRTANLETVSGDYLPLPLSASCVTRNTARQLLVTSCALPGPAFSRILPDSGAQFSSISKKLADKYMLQIKPPAASEPTQLNGATSAMSVPRLGYVEIPVQVHFPLDSKRQAVSLDTKKFEVLEIKHDFILGIEVLRFLFPDDQLLAFAGPHSCITDAPSAASLQPALSTQVASFLHSCSSSAFVCDEYEEESEPQVAAASSTSSASPSHSQ